MAAHPRNMDSSVATTRTSSLQNDFDSGDMAGTLEISKDKPVDWVVYGLFILLGLGSWTTINGLFVELPLFYHQLPEQGKIYADVSLTIQLANVVPLGITVARRYCGLGVVVPTYVVLSVGVAVMVILGSVWQETAVIGGKEHSVALLAGVFGTAAVDCATSILFWPFVGSFQRQYTTALSVGEGLSGVIASVFSWIQTVNGQERLLFSVSVYFYFLGGVVFISCVAFLALNRSVRAKAQRQRTLNTTPVSSHVQDEASLLLLTKSPFDDDDNSNDNDDDDEPPSQPTTGISTREKWCFLVMLAVLSSMQNGIRASVLPYIISDTKLLQAASTTSVCVDPVGAFLALWYRPTLGMHGVIAMGWTGLAICLFVLALVGGGDWKQHLGAGVAITSNFAFAFSKASAILHLKTNTTTRDADDTMFKVGACIQVGSFVGAMALFFLVNYTTIFPSW